MNSRLLSYALRTLSVVTLGLGLATQAQNADRPPQPPLHFTGLLNDYTPSNVMGGPWEMHGNWKLDIFADSADFTAALTMETSDYGIFDSTGVDPTNTATRSAHTHNIILHGSLSTDTSHCSAYSPATTGPVIVVTGQPQIITGNGGPAPFQLKGPSTLWICIAGGTQVPYSNISLTFSDGPATTHFGSQYIHGVVLPEHPH